jgi:hypothetical protein
MARIAILAFLALSSRATIGVALQTPTDRPCQTDQVEFNSSQIDLINVLQAPNLMVNVIERG